MNDSYDRVILELVEQKYRIDRILTLYVYLHIKTLFCECSIERSNLTVSEFSLHCFSFKWDPISLKEVYTLVRVQGL